MSYISAISHVYTFTFLSDVKDSEERFLSLHNVKSVRLAQPQNLFREWKMLMTHWHVTGQKIIIRLLQEIHEK